MSEKHKVAVYHRTQRPIYQRDDFHQMDQAYGFAEYKGWDVVAVYPDTPSGSGWAQLVKDSRVDGDFDTVLVTTEKPFEPLVYHGVPQDPHEALRCGVADEDSSGVPCELYKPCSIHTDVNA